jgi:membrane associated rhomboid family serine protease
MIPIRDVIPSRTTPWITIGLVAASLVTFCATAFRPAPDLDLLFFTHGLVPSAFSWTAVLTSLFLHTGWLHLVSNLIVLWLFGATLEDRMGHVRFFAFYALAAAFAAAVQIWAAPELATPIVGASGAVAGVMGAYFVLFPTSRVLVLVSLVIWTDVIEVPALFFLGLWFVSQVLSGLGHVPTQAIGGLAFWSQAGGFVAGLSAVWIFRRRERLDVAWWSG